MRRPRWPILAARAFGRAARCLPMGLAGPKCHARALARLAPCGIFAPRSGRPDSGGSPVVRACRRATSSFMTASPPPVPPDTGLADAPRDGPNAGEVDFQLVQRTVAGDQKAFELLVIKYQRRIE